MIEGVFNIDKPSGMTSHDVVNRMRRLTNVRRIGHAGTLDPLASGVLLLCVGRATRLVEYLVGQPKRYWATVRLGQETDSYDADGEIVNERPYSHITQSQIEQTLADFVGEIEQLPPMYSAIKKEGQPLYKLARQGIEIEREPRKVTFFDIQLLKWDAPEMTIDVRCSSGTYIRSLAHDVGKRLGCGGHIAQLRRTAVGSFAVANSVALETITPENISEHCLAMKTAVAHLPRITLPLEQATTLLNGRLIPRQDDYKVGTLAQIFTEEEQFWGIAVAHADQWKARKMLPPINGNPNE